MHPSEVTLGSLFWPLLQGEIYDLQKYHSFLHLCKPFQWILWSFSGITVPGNGAAFSFCELDFSNGLFIASIAPSSFVRIFGIRCQEKLY